MHGKSYLVFNQFQNVDYKRLLKLDYRYTQINYGNAYGEIELFGAKYRIF